MIKSNSNLLNYFKNKSRILVYLRDFGSASLFLNILNEFISYNFLIDIYIDNPKLIGLIKVNDPNLNILDKLDNISLNYDYLLICQSSFISEVEKILITKIKNIYILQDYYMDFKYQDKKYLTPFQYKNSILKKYNCIFLDKLKKNTILNTNLKIEKSLLIIGAKSLLSDERNLAFITDFLSKINSKLFYKPHPMENKLDLNLLDKFKLNIVTNLKELIYFPKYIISPFSTLGYDIPLYLNSITDEKVHIYHGFGKHFKNKTKKDYPAWEIMINEYSINYFEKDLNHFISLINAKSNRNYTSKEE